MHCAISQWLHVLLNFEIAQPFVLRDFEIAQFGLRNLQIYGQVNFNLCIQVYISIATRSYKRLSTDSVHKQRTFKVIVVGGRARASTIAQF